MTNSRAALVLALVMLGACGESEPEPFVDPAPANTTDNATTITDNRTTPDDRPTNVDPDVESPPADNSDLDFLIRHGIKTPKPRTPGTIRLATYNVENLFDDEDDPKLSGRNEDIDDTIPVERREELARVIRSIDADILCLQEIESERALRWFIVAYLADLGYEHVVSIDAGDDRGIEQAVLSRFPMTDVENWANWILEGVHPEKWGNNDNWHAGEQLRFHRSPLMAEIEVPGGHIEGLDSPYRLTVVVVHHKSGGPGAYWREAESKGLVELLEPMNDGKRNIAILGDFNATTDQPSVQTYLDAGFGDLFAGETGANTITHASNRRIDLILVNSALRSEIQEESRFVLGTIQRPSRNDPPPPGYAADHYPVVIDLIPSDQ